MNILEIAKQTKALAEKATPEPWAHAEMPGQKLAHDLYIKSYEPERCLAILNRTERDIFDARLIAHTRTAAPQLADAVIEMVELLRDVAKMNYTVLKEWSGQDAGAPVVTETRETLQSINARELLEKLGLTTEGGE